MIAMRCHFTSIILAAGVQARFVELPIAQINRRATSTAHTWYKTTADDPVQTGIVSNCNKFYDVVTGDNCATVEAAFGITNAQFLAWNPAVSSDCETNFWVGDSYCVGTAAAASVKITSTAPHTTVRSTADLPTQSGTICNCNMWYDLVTNDTCATIESTFGITLAQFLAWNPAVSSNCETNFWIGDSYCVGTTTKACASSTSPNSTAKHTSYLTTPNNPTQTGTISTCNKWYDIMTGDTCATIETAFNITNAQFLLWNPAVSSDCGTNFWVGDSYCVGVGTARASAPVSSTYSILPQANSSYVPATITKGTTFPPTQTQAGQVSYCNNWTWVRAGDTCVGIQSRYSTSMSMDDFILWNPALGANCTGLYQNHYVCVGIQYQTSALHTTSATSFWYPSYTPTTASQLNATFIPTPAQTGIAANCLAYYKANVNDTCETIVATEGYLTVQDLEEYNPALGSDCAGLITGNYYCVMNGTLPLPSVATVAPTATQTGIISTCVNWYRADSGDTCALITEIFGTFSSAQFLEWNPATLSDCSGLTIGDYYCVAIPSTPTTRTTTYPSPTPFPTNGVGPQPEQPGIPAACADYWFVGTSDTCASIARVNNVTDAQLGSYNPALGANCSGLTADYYICVGMPSNYTTTSASNGTASSSAAPTTKSISSVATPSPVQAGIISGCERWYLVESGDRCYNIVADAGIILTNFYTWNPAVKSDCSGLEAFVYVCIGISGSATAITAGTPVPATAAPTTTNCSLPTPTPIQAGMVGGCTRFYYVETGDGCYNLATNAGVTLSNLYSWNPALNLDCSGLQAFVYVCIGISGAPNTITTGTPVPTS